eukprot:PhF_6_TR40984/c0_g1_i3/m.62077
MPPRLAPLPNQSKRSNTTTASWTPTRTTSRFQPLTEHDLLRIQRLWRTSLSLSRRITSTHSCHRESTNDGCRNTLSTRNLCYHPYFEKGQRRRKRHTFKTKDCKNNPGKYNRHDLRHTKRTLRQRCDQHSHQTVYVPSFS